MTIPTTLNGAGSPDRGRVGVLAERTRRALRTPTSSLLSHPAAPASLAASLMALGYLLAAGSGQLPGSPPPALIAIIVVCIVMYLLSPRTPFVMPRLRPRAVVLVRIASLCALSLELMWFGVPLLGQVPYNEFGWPVIHHLAVVHWVLVLFGDKRKGLDLLISLVIAALVFNRQLAMFAVLAYLMTKPMTLGRLGFIGLGAIALMALLGAVRNQVLDVDTSAFEDASGFVFAGPLFFIYVYLLGPLHVGLGMESEIWDNFLINYWNTVPEWALLVSRLEVPAPVSFLFFYGTTALVATALRRSRSWNLRSAGSLIHCYTFFSFFSWVVLSTPVISNFLVVAGAASMFAHTRKR